LRQLLSKSLDARTRHELGAMFGPLAVAAVLAHRDDHHLAFAMLLLPALICRKDLA
jgi:hypothetical protein